jgi:CDP-diacylglycerol--glycerol-3-phosphate 3-phosphatidyltransferase
MNLPNKLTVLRILMIPMFLVVVSAPLDWGTVTAMNASVPVTHIVAAIIFAVASFTDFLDGHLARKWNLVTNFGKFADPLADKMLVMTAFITLVALGKAPAWVVAIIVMRELAVTGLRLLIVENSGEVMAAALPGKLKTVTQMFSIIFLFIGNLPFSALGVPVDQILLYAALVFTIWSGYDYFAKSTDVFKGSM